MCCLRAIAPAAAAAAAGQKETQPTNVCFKLFPQEPLQEGGPKKTSYIAGVSHEERSRLM